MAKNAKGHWFAPVIEAATLIWSKFLFSVELIFAYMEFILHS